MRLKTSGSDGGSCCTGGGGGGGEPCRAAGATEAPVLAADEEGGHPMEGQRGDQGADGSLPGVLPRDPQPLLRRGDRVLECGRAQSHRLGVVRVARQSQRGVAGAGILEGEQGPGFQVVYRVHVQGRREGG